MTTNSVNGSDKSHCQLIERRSADNKKSFDLIANASEKIEPFTYERNVTKSFLDTWLHFPTKPQHVLFNTLMLQFHWLFWANRSIAALDHGDKTIRDRLASSVSVVGTCAGLFLVLAVAGFLAPPIPRDDTLTDNVLVDVYGILMFTSLIAFATYIGYAFILFYPALQSLRDDTAYDAFEHLKKSFAGNDLMLFNIGLHALLMALILAAFLVYSLWAAMVITCVIAVFLGVVVIIARSAFIALDPISAIHLGLTNDTDVIHRAQLLSEYISHKVSIRSLDRAASYPEQSAPVASNNIFTDENSNNNISATQLNGIQSTISAADESKDATIVAAPLSSVLTFSELFGSTSPLLTSLSVEEVTAILFQLEAAGCKSTSQLLSYLDETKQNLFCSCIQAQFLQASSCDANRRLGCWLPALLQIKIVPFHAAALVEYLRPHLK